MTYETAIILAHQRMREIGKTPDSYHIEPISIVGKLLERQNGEITLKAYNAYYYLVNYEKYFGFIILSDTGYFNADDYTENTPLEFTGLIRIIKKSPQWNLNYVINHPPDGSGGSSLPPLPYRAIDFIKVSIH